MLRLNIIYVGVCSLADLNPISSILSGFFTCDALYRCGECRSIELVVARKNVHRRTSEATQRTVFQRRFINEY